MKDKNELKPVEKLTHPVFGQLAMLISGKVVMLARTGKQDGDNEFFGLVIETITHGKKERFTLWLLSDFEGNAPGGFSLEPFETEDGKP